MSVSTSPALTAQTTGLLHDDGGLSIHVASQKERSPQLLLADPGNQGRMETRKKARYKKSRDGCLSCKAKHRKCDEKTPSCTNCVQRRLNCEYRRDLKWKAFGDSEQPKPHNFGIQGQSRRPDDVDTRSDSTQSCSGRNFSRENRSNSSRSKATNHDTTQAMADSSLEADRSQFQEIPESSVDPFVNTFLGGSEHAMEFDTLFSDINVIEPSEDDFLLGLTNSEEIGSNNTDLLSAFPNLQFGDSGGTEGLFVAGDQPDMSTYSGNGNEDTSTLNNNTWPLGYDIFSSPSLGMTRRTIFSLLQQPSVRGDSPENIALVFDRRVCEVLCIKEEWTGNPWRKIVWPLAQEHPALYHAIAAMTCFHGYNRLPQVRAEGVRHFHKSIRSLTVDSSTSMPPEVVLIATLALGLARSWYHPRSSNGIKHIQEAKTLLRDVVSRNLPPRPVETNLRLGFIANLWIYMDVITRVTCHKIESVDFDLMIACSQLSRSAASRHQVDPLMGCAGTLFPLIGRVADLVKRVRKAKARINSPTTVSLAVELKTAIERWTPSITSEIEPDFGSLTSSTTDLVQTANAYKWAALLLLYQAIPEIPSQLSCSQIAQKVLVLIATVPLDSRAVIFHVLPLMIAGCEAMGTEDRDWVRSRWQSLSSTGNSSGIVERCIELTSEVWRRRDIHKANCGSCQHPSALTTEVTRPLNPDPEIVNLPLSGDEGTLSGMNRGNEGCDSSTHTEPPGLLDFSNPAMFTLETDIIPTPQCTEHTVRSRLHWLAVMEEWGWEVMLG